MCDSIDVKNTNRLKTIILVKPNGFCAGVARATQMLDGIVRCSKKKVYVLHEIVHNSRVINDYRSKGVIFVTGIAEIPDRSVVVISAHGVSPKIRQDAENRKLQIVDATCPLVMKVHWEAKRYVK
jgi:4-hydroxy-3-methylbut-2-en-1-yl diphosphate reductase